MGQAGVDVDVCNAVGDEVEDESQDGDRKLKKLEFVQQGLVRNFIKGFFEVEEDKAGWK